MRAGYCRFEHADQIRLSPCRPPGSLVPAGFQGKRGGVAAKKKDATQKKDAREDAPGVVAEHGGDDAEVAEDRVQVVERAAAIDVAKGSGMVCTRVPGSRPDRRRQKVWRVGATYGEVTALMDHLRARASSGWCSSPPAITCDVRVHEFKWEAPLEAWLRPGV